MLFNNNAMNNFDSFDVEDAFASETVSEIIIIDNHLIIYI